MRKLFTSGALATALVAGGVQAQVQSPDAGFYGLALGSWIIDSGKDDWQKFGIPGGFVSSRTSPGDGWLGRLGVGFAFGNGFDVGAAAQYIDLGKGKSALDNAPAGPGPGNNLYGQGWAGDIEIGYTYRGAQWGVRPFIGARYAEWTHQFESTNGQRAKMPFRGFGPRAGVDGSVRVMESVSLFGGVDASVLFGSIDEKSVSNWLSISSAGRANRTAWHVGGNLGVAYEVVPMVNLALGYQVQYWNGVNVAISDVTNLGGHAGRGDRLVHGPFARITYNLGSPVGAAPPAPAAAPAGKKSYIVFFDFDRAVITPTAATTIKQAATDAKAGKSTRLDVTGHADKSGGDAYNMALSLRRGNAVKDQLVREGIPAAQIAVVGRGESMPLVQTADGVREPQNRRVEIVLN